jgi:hypothetical protein
MEASIRPVQKALFEEQVALVVRSPIRMIGAGVLFAVTLGMTLLDGGPTGPALLPFAAVYVLYAFANFLSRRLSRTRLGARRGERPYLPTRTTPAPPRAR